MLRLRRLALLAAGGISIFPTRAGLDFAFTLMSAAIDDRALVVSMSAIETVPVRPPLQLPPPLVLVIYGQTADCTGWLWEKDDAGARRLTRTFHGRGFKEYAGVTAVQTP
jgi:hypothetical protein